MSYRHPGPYGSGPTLLDPNERLKLSADFELPDDIKCPDASRPRPGFDLGSPCGFNTGPLTQLGFEIRAAIRLREWAADVEEFKLLSTYGVGRHFGNQVYRAFPGVSDYVRYREGYFGIRGTYLQYAAESDKELAGLPQKVRELILTPSQVHPGVRKPDGTRLTPMEEQTAQAIFYRWVRVASQKKFGSLAEGLPKWYDDYMRLAASVSADITPLKWALVPRPERVAAEGGNLRFILGTVSDHTRGIAVDVKAGNNPDISPATWRFIMDYTGMAFKYDLSRWINEPERLYTDIKSMSDRFRDTVKKNTDFVADYQSLLNKEPGARSMPSVFPVPFGHGMLASKAGYLLHKIREQGRDPKRGGDIDKYIQCAGSTFLDSNPIDVVLDTALSEAGKSDTQLKAALRPLVGGFLNLERQVVMGFRNFGFTWGVTLPSPDLMHFTRDGKTPPAMGDFNASHSTTA